MARIFVSYRRQDSSGHAGRLYDHLRAFFGSGRVFMDVDGIDPGTDFTQALDERVAAAEVMVAVIGPSWSSIAGPDGVRRLHNKDDYVFREIESALARGVEVIPVLVGGAAVVDASQLPLELAELARRQMYVISDTAFDAGAARLIRGVERSAARIRWSRSATPRPALQSGRPRWGRLLLLYEPFRAPLWMLHILFFNVLGMSILIPGALWLATSDKSLAARSLGVLFVIGVLVRGTVFLFENRTARPLRRWLLLYNPPRVTVRALHVLFFVMLVLGGVFPFTVIQLMNAQTSHWAKWMVAEAGIFFGLVAFAIREVCAFNDPLKPPLRDTTWFGRLLLVWKPRYVLAWLPRTVFYLACLLLSLTVPNAFTDADGNFGNVTYTMIRGSLWLLILLAMLAASARGAARAIEVNWPGDRALQPLPLVRTAMLIYRPWRPAGWIPIALFWIGTGALLTIVAGGQGVLVTVGFGETAGPFLVVLSGLLVAFSWIWAGMYRPPVRWAQSPAPVSSGV